MKWANVRLILGREIRDQLRDRRTLFMIAVLPLLLYPLLGTIFFQVTQFMREHPTEVLVLGASEVTGLTDFPPLIENNRFSSALFNSERDAGLIHLNFQGDEPTAPAVPGASPVDHGAGADRVDEGRSLVRRRKYDVLIYFSSGFGDKLDRVRNGLVQAAQGAARDDEPAPAVPSPMIYFNTASEKSQMAHARVSRALDRWRASIVEQVMVESKLPVIAAKPFEVHIEDVAQVGHRDAALWAKVLPFVLLIWALTGAFYPAVDTCAGEKERGTLETLLSSPAERSEIVWGKLLMVMLFSMVTAVLNLTSMGLTGAFIIRQLNNIGAFGPATQVTAPPPITVLWLLVALIPMSALFGALCIACASFARSSKEGQYYLVPLILITMPLMVIPIAPGIEPNLGNSLIPVTGMVLLLRTLLEGNTVDALIYAPPVIAVTVVCCLLAIRWAVEQFNSESVLFRESEQLDLRLWLKRLVTDRRETPSIAEAITCAVLILLIQFFMQMALPVPRPGVYRDAALLVFVSQVVIIALPALMMTIVLTNRRAKTLLLDSLPPLSAVPFAMLLATALHPAIHRLGIAVQQLYPISPEIASESQRFVGALENGPTPWLAFLWIAFLPAICEEFAFRGFILSGLRHIGHKWWAIVLSAVIFGLAHPILQQTLTATVMGVVLAYIAVQSGSLVPAMLFHLTHNSLMLLSRNIDIGQELYIQHPQLNWFAERIVQEGEVHYVYGWPFVIVGLLLAGLIWARMRRFTYLKTTEEEFQDALRRQSALAVAE